MNIRLIAKIIFSAIVLSSSILYHDLAQAQAAVTIPSGVYLYGQSPHQIAQDYMVFEAAQDKVIGAFYRLESEYSCFWGNIESHQLNLTVMEPYSQETYAYQVPLQTVVQAAARGGRSHYTPPEIQGTHRLEQISSQDHQILNACQADPQAARAPTILAP